MQARLPLPPGSPVKTPGDSELRAPRLSVARGGGDSSAVDDAAAQS